MVGHKILHGISNLVPTQATENKQFLEVVQVCVPDTRQLLPATKPTFLESQPSGSYWLMGFVRRMGFSRRRGLEAQGDTAIDIGQY